MDDEQTYRLIGEGPKNNTNNQENNINDNDIFPGLTTNSNNSNRINNTENNENNKCKNKKIGFMENINNLTDIMNNLDSDNFITKFIIFVLLFHPIISLWIQNKPIVRKTYTKKQIKFIQIILLIFMSICLVGFMLTYSNESNWFFIFFLKALLFSFILIHSGILNSKYFKKNFMKNH